MDLFNLPLLQLSKKMKNREISSKQLVELCLRRIERFNPDVNAIILLKKESALKDANILDKERDKGKIKGVLHGIPFTLKDVYDTKGDRVTAGCLGFKDYIAKDDGTIAKRLKDAGGILLGKTNTPEFENGADTDNLIFGKTRNPYNFKHSAGGSSGGAAAAVASGMSFFDIGVDTGGSLRIPAHYCGVSTIRPSIGRIPWTGNVYGDIKPGLFGACTVQGPISRHVADLEILLKIISGPDGVDPRVLPLSIGNISDNKNKKLNISYSFYDAQKKVSKDIEEAILKASLALRDQGHNVKEDNPEYLSEGFDIFYELLGSASAEIIEDGLKNLNVSQISPLFQKLLHLLKKKSCDTKTFLKRWDRWDLFRSQMLQYMQNYDAFLYPVTASSALKLPHEMWDEKNFSKIRYAWQISATLFPTATVRSSTSSEGLPIGIQIVANPYREDLALFVAKKLEEKLGGWVSP